MYYELQEQGFEPFTSTLGFKSSFIALPHFFIKSIEHKIIKIKVLASN
jgi:hypothetical protein